MNAIAGRHPEVNSTQGVMTVAVMPSLCRMCFCSDRLKHLLVPSFSFRFTNYFTSKAMSSAWFASKAIVQSGATEHGIETLPQSAAVANIIFVNIDWKRDRHNSAKATKRNLKQLTDTTSSIVTSMKAAVICCCEAGTAILPMSSQEMSDMADAMREAWEKATTEFPAISFHFEDGAPYLTIWDGNRCKCTHAQILKDVYTVPRQPRTAQAFLCTMPGDGDEEGINVVNVHAPSGTPRLTDTQRFDLIQNLLQSSSMITAKKSIGESRFLIGGDMNTNEGSLGQIFKTLEIKGILKKKYEVMVPLDGKHGDICVVGGFTTSTVTERARNHDPQHVPYGIAWRKQPQHTTEQLTTTPPPQTQIPTAPDATRKSRATEAQAIYNYVATPTPKQAQFVISDAGRGPTHLATEQLTSCYRAPDTMPKAPDHIGAINPQTDVSCDADTETTQHVTEQPTTTPRTQISTAPDTMTKSSATGATTATVRSERQLPQLPLVKLQPVDTDKLIETMTAQHLHEHEVPELDGPGQEIAYKIVNAFLDNVTFKSTDAEDLIKGVILRTGEVARYDMLLNVDEVFQPIFFHYPNGLRDKTRAEPRTPRRYIQQWRDIAEWRQMVGTDNTCERLQYATEQLATNQVQNIFHQYIDDLKHREATEDQNAQPWNNHKSRAEVVLHRLCGSKKMAMLIWQIGLPDIAEAEFAISQFLLATEQQRALPQDVRESIETSTRTILTWVSTLANSIHDHKATRDYQEHARKSGTQKHKSGLNQTELREKKEQNRAARLKYGRKPSTASGSHTWPAQAS